MEFPYYIYDKLKNNKGIIILILSIIITGTAFLSNAFNVKDHLFPQNINKVTNQNEDAVLAEIPDCRLITPTSFQWFKSQGYNFKERNDLGYTFSINESNDYFADIFYLQAVKNDFGIMVELPEDLIPAYFRSFPEGTLGLNKQGNKIKITSNWKGVPTSYYRQLIIFYDATKKNELLVTGDRTYALSGLSVTGDRTYTLSGIPNYNCSGNWKYFHEFLYMSSN